MTMPLVPFPGRLLSRLCLAALLMLPAGTALLAQATPLSPEQFRQELTTWTSKVQELRDHPENAGALAHALPSEWPVQQEGSIVHVPTDWLRRGLMRINGDHAHAGKDAAFLADAIAARLAVAGSDAGAAATPARAQLDHILARREFRGIHPPTATETAKSHFWAWIREHIDLMIGRIAPHPSILQGLVWMVILLAMGTALRFLWVFARGVDHAAPNSGLPPDRPSALPWQAWLQRAREAAGDGNYRDAIHLTYWSAISWLESQGAWIPDRARTPREYLRLLPAQAPQRHRLYALTQRFEPVWYGGRPASAVDFDAMLQELEELGCR